MGPVETNVPKKGRGSCLLGASVVTCMWRVKGIKVVLKLLGVLCLVDDKGVNHIPKPDLGRIGGSADGSGFEVP